jgi:hypothetical protein
VSSVFTSRCPGSREAGGMHDDARAASHPD